MFSFLFRGFLIFVGIIIFHHTAKACYTGAEDLAESHDTLITRLWAQKLKSEAELTKRKMDSGMYGRIKEVDESQQTGQLNLSPTPSLEAPRQPDPPQPKLEKSAGKRWQPELAPLLKLFQDLRTRNRNRSWIDDKKK